MPSHANRSPVSCEGPGRPEEVEVGLRLREPVEQDRADPERRERGVRDRPAGLEQPARERAAADAAVLVHPLVGCQPPEEPEPDREGLAVRAPRVATELGHHREREHGVADEDHEQRRRPAAGVDELEPDERDEPDGRRPAAEPFRIGGRRPGADAEPAQQPGAQVVERRERVEEVPRRPDERGDEGQPDPAVDPQEERRDRAVAGVAEDALGDDPRDGDEADDPQDDPDDRRRQVARAGRSRRRRPDVARQHEQEREPDRDGGPGQVDRQREPARVRRVELVAEDRRRGDDGRDGDPADGRREPGSQAPEAPADHGAGVVELPRRV